MNLTVLKIGLNLSKMLFIEPIKLGYNLITSTKLVWLYFIVLYVFSTNKSSRSNNVTIKNKQMLQARKVYNQV